MIEYEYELIGDRYQDTAQVPKNHDIYYRCTKCDGIIPSVPKDSGGCTCGNVFIDKDYWRLVVMNLRELEVLRKRRRRS